MLRDHERFWAFILLILAILALVWTGTSLDAVATTSDNVNEGREATLLARLRIVDAAVAGLIGLAGMAAQALFRTSSTEKALAETNAALVSNQLPPQQVEVINTPANPANVSEVAPHPAPTEEEDAPWNKVK